MRAVGCPNGHTPADSAGPLRNYVHKGRFRSIDMQVYGHNPCGRSASLSIGVRVIHIGLTTRHRPDRDPAVGGVLRRGRGARDHRPHRIRRWRSVPWACKGPRSRTLSLLEVRGRGGAGLGSHAGHKAVTPRSGCRDADRDPAGAGLLDGEAAGHGVWGAPRHVRNGAAGQGVEILTATSSLKGIS